MDDEPAAFRVLVGVIRGNPEIDVHRRLIGMRDAGKAILLVSVELDEIMSLADRILVMFNGEIVGEVAQADATEQQLGLMMAGERAPAVEAGA